MLERDNALAGHKLAKFNSQTVSKNAIKCTTLKIQKCLKFTF